MDIEKKLLTKKSLEELVSKLSKENTSVFAPVEKNNVIDFSPISDIKEMAQDYIVTVQSAKSVVFPKVESLFMAKSKSRSAFSKLLLSLLEVRNQFL